jgi:mercuric ion transport protein
VSGEARTRSWLSRMADKTGVLGSIVTAMGCATCFPALASLGAAIGLGFLSRYEGLFIRVLLPLFAALALLANGWSALEHRRWPRAVIALLGPLLVLAAVFVMRASGHRTGWLLYPGLALMIAVATWDLIAPARKRRRETHDAKCRG